MKAVEKGKKKKKSHPLFPRPATGPARCSINTNTKQNTQINDCHINDCHINDCHITDCHINDCHITDCHINDCHINDCHINDCHINDCHINDCHINDCHINDCHINDCHKVLGVAWAEGAPPPPIVVAEEAQVEGVPRVVEGPVLLVDHPPAETVRGVRDGLTHRDLDDRTGSVFLIDF
ncbi:hypothetical protein ACOMHN_033876 [Nucella lapillus]